MSNRPLTHAEWRQSVADAFSSAVKSTYQDLIDEAVKAEREACAKVCDNWESDEAFVANIAEAIRARGKA